MNTVNETSVKQYIRVTTMKYALLILHKSISRQTEILSLKKKQVATNRILVQSLLIMKDGHLVRSRKED